MSDEQPGCLMVTVTAHAGWKALGASEEQWEL
jgi:hypothetical protein